MRLDRRGLLGGLALLLSACASPPPPQALPEFRVAPAAYGQSLSLQQRLQVEPLDRQARETTRELDALLMLDAQQLRLVALSLNTRVMTLQWDGVDLQVQRHPLLPAVVDPARVLRDIALVYAPLPALQALLPKDWRLVQEGEDRALYQGDALRLRVQYREGRRVVEIVNPTEHYKLRIESQAQEGSE